MPAGDQETVEHRVLEPGRTPALSLLLGYGAMAPFVLAAVAVWLASGELRDLVLDLTRLWGGAILIFLSGVRRGLSFRTVGGPTGPQIAMTFWLFGLGLLALLLPLAGLALGLLLAGFLSLAVLDPWAARRGEAPLFFQRLRPVQMAIPVVCLGLILVNLTLSR